MNQYLNDLPDGFRWDPWSHPGFFPELLPQCEGARTVPTSLRSDMAERMSQFIALYYAMNRAGEMINAAQSDADPRREAGARKLLAELSRIRDSLEDRCAAEGFIARPELDEGRYVDVRFQWSGRPMPDRVFVMSRSAKILLEP